MEKMKFVEKTFIHLLTLPFTKLSIYIHYICTKPDNWTSEMKLIQLNQNPGLHFNNVWYVYSSVSPDSLCSSAFFLFWELTSFFVLVFFNLLLDIQESSLLIWWFFESLSNAPTNKLFICLVIFVLLCFNIYFSFGFVFVWTQHIAVEKTLTWVVFHLFRCLFFSSL